MSNSRLEQLLELLESNSSDSFILFGIAKEYEGKENFEKALQFYLELKSKDPDYIGLYYHLGKLYETVEEFPLADETYQLGITVATKLNDQHSLQELKNAKLNLEMELL